MHWTITSRLWSGGTRNSTSAGLHYLPVDFFWNLTHTIFYFQFVFFSSKLHSNLLNERKENFEIDISFRNFVHVCIFVTKSQSN